MGFTRHRPGCEYVRRLQAAQDSEKTDRVLELMNMLTSGEYPWCGINQTTGKSDPERRSASFVP